MCKQKLKKNRLVTDRQAGRKHVLLLELTALGTLVRRSNHLSNQGGRNDHTVYVLTNQGRFDLATSLSKQVMV